MVCLLVKNSEEHQQGRGSKARSPEAETPRGIIYFITFNLNSVNLLLIKKSQENEPQEYIRGK